MNYYLKRILHEIRRRLRPDMFLKKGHAFPPLRIDVEITHRCNLSCNMCSYNPKGLLKDHFSNPKRSYVEKDNDMPSIDSWERFFKEISHFSPIINLTGGEPMMHPIFFVIVNIIKKYKMIVTMTTNGTFFTKDNVKKIIDSKIDSIVISIDGAEEVHNEIRGRDCFKNMMEGIVSLNALKEKTGTKKPRINVNSTISWQNYKDLSFANELFKTVRPHKWNFSHLFIGNGDLVDGDIKVLRNKRDDIEALKELYLKFDPVVLKEEIMKLKRGKYSKQISFFPDLSSEELLIYYTKPEASLRNNCFYPYFTCVVQGDGSIIPCLYYKIGSIKDDFKSIWNSPEYREFRLNLRKGLFSKCSRCCGMYE